MIGTAKKITLIGALSFSAFLLMSCGFKPVYGTHSSDDTPVAEQMNQVAVDGIANRQGQIMRNELIDRMYGKGRPAKPTYHLLVTLKESEEALGIQADATSTRTLMNMYATYILSDLKGREILHGTAHSISSFNTLVDEYGNLSAHNAAIERTVHECSEQIVNRLSLYFAEKDEGYKPLDQEPLTQPDTLGLPGQPAPAPTLPGPNQIPPPSPDDSFSNLRR